MGYATFNAHGTQCQLITREGVVSYDLVVVALIGGVQTAWGGDPNDNSIIAEDFTAQTVMDKGGRRAFILWGVEEAKRRALARFLPPDPNDKVASVIWNLQNSVHTSPDGTTLDVDPAPLP